MTESIRNYKAINAQKNAVAAMLKAQNIDPGLLSDDKLETVAYHISEVYRRLSKIETQEDKEKYCLTVMVMAFSAILEPSILEDYND